MRNKNAVYVRMTPDERELLESRAAARKMGLAPYIRYAIAKEAKKDRENPNDHELNGPRDKAIHVKLSKSERERVRAIASNSGLTIAAYVRNAVVLNTVPAATRSVPETAHIRYEVSRVYNNLNQMARVLNEARNTGFRKFPRLDEVLTTVEATRDELLQLGDKVDRYLVEFEKGASQAQGE